MNEPIDVDGHALWESAWRTIGDFRMRGANSFCVYAVFDESARPKLVRLAVDALVPLEGIVETLVTAPERNDDGPQRTF